MKIFIDNRSKIPLHFKTIRYPLLSLRGQREMEICQQQSEIVMRHLPAISIYNYVGGRQITALWALEWAWQLVFGQSKGFE